MTQGDISSMSTQKPNEPSGLHTKLAAVAADVGYIERDGTNAFQNYKYTSAEAMLGAIRGPLSSRNITLLESVESVEDRDYTTTKGKASVITTVRVAFTFVDGDSGQRETLTWLGRGDDNADKGLGKAYTNAVKTFLRAQFLIPSGDDPEADHRTDERAADRAPVGPKRTPEVLQAARDAMRLAGIDDATAEQAVADGDDDYLRAVTRRALAKVPKDGPPIAPAEEMAL